MSRDVFAALCDLTDELQRLTSAMEPELVRCAVAGIVARLDVLIDDVVGIAIPTLHTADAHTGPCPVCREAACTHGQFLHAKETR